MCGSSLKNDLIIILMSRNTDYYLIDGALSCNVDLDNDDAFYQALENF